jgi:hypothetical protein
VLHVTYLLKFALNLTSTIEFILKSLVLPANTEQWLRKMYTIELSIFPESFNGLSVLTQLTEDIINVCFFYLTFLQTVLKILEFAL